MVLDFDLESSTGTTTLASDVNYVVSGIVNLNDTIIEGGTVLKYHSGARLNILGTVTCLTGPYRPATLTAYDDNTIGDPVGNGTPTGTYADCALSLALGGELKYLNIRYAREAIYCGNADYSVSHSQILFCDAGFHSETANFTNCNILMYRVGTNFYGSFFKGRVEHLTADQAQHLTCDYALEYLHWCNEAPSSSLRLINSLTASITNGFGSVPTSTDHVHNFLDGRGVFQAVGAGMHYLVSDSTNRNAGTQAIQPKLAAALRSKTTYSPLPLLSVTVPPSTISAAHVARGGQIPDLGYGYDPMDALASWCVVGGGTLWLRAGTVIGYLNGPGICLEDGAGIISQGAPTARNLFVDYRAVQELPITLGNGPTLPIRSSIEGSVAWFHFTDFFRLGGGFNFYSAYLWDDNVGDLVPRFFDRLEFSHCSLRGGICWFYGGGSVSLTNNLFEGPEVQALAYDKFFAFNNLFRRSDVSFDPGGKGQWLARDNVFDSGSVNWNGDGYHDHNAFINEEEGAEGDIVLSGFNYRFGPLGEFYQPSANNPLLNAGSRSAIEAGLDHYTTQANEQQDSDTVDIGLHFPLSGTLGISAQPLSQTVPSGVDALFSVTASGPPALTYQWFHNGVPLAGATDATFAISRACYMDSGTYYVAVKNPFGQVTSSGAVLTVPPPATISSQPQSRAVVQGADVTFAVTAAGESLLYRWKKNGLLLSDSANISGSTSPQLHLSSVTPSDTGVYVAEVGDPVCKVPSAPAALTVLTLVITNPPIAEFTTARPYLQLQGYATAPVASLMCDIANAAGTFTGRKGIVVDKAFDEHLFAFVTNYFQFYDVALTNGPNVITVHATDPQGHPVSKTATVTLDFATASAPPAFTLFWPQTGMNISGNTFYIRGRLDDPTAQISAQVTAGATTSGSAGIVERNGTFWIENLPLAPGNNTVEITATSAAGLHYTTTITVTKSTDNLTITYTESGEALYRGRVAVRGTAPPGYAVTVNGAPAEVNETGDWAADSVPVIGTGTAVFDAAATPGGGGVSPVLNASLEIEMPACLVVTEHAFSGYSQYDLRYVSDPHWVMEDSYTKGYTSQLEPGADGQWRQVYNGSSDQLNKHRYDPFSSFHFQANWSNLADDGWAEDFDWGDGNIIHSSGTDVANRADLTIPHRDGRQSLGDSGWLYVVHYFAGVSFSKTYFDGAYAELKVGAHTKAKLYTGGKAGINHDHLFHVWCGAETYGEPPIYGPSNAESWYFTPFGSMPPPQLTVLQKHPGDDGYFWTVLPDNSEADATVDAPTNHYYARVEAPKLPHIDLGIDSNNNDQIEPDDDAIEDQTPGKYIPVNDGDEDGDEIPDFADGYDKFGEPDAGSQSAGLTPMILTFPPLVDVTRAQVRFSYSESDPNGADRHTDSEGTWYTPAPGGVRLWTRDGGQYRRKAQVDQYGMQDGNWVQIGDRVASGAVYWATNVPTFLYVEGITEGTYTIKVELDPDSRSGFISHDEVVVTVVSLDLDVDSDNGDGYAMPDRSLRDDQIEDLPNTPGKIVGVNDGDSDSDGIPGFADGFNWSGDGDSANWDYTSPHDTFVPFVLQLPAGVDVAKAQLSLGYDSSDPRGANGVTKDDGPPAQWNPGTGSLRLWKKPADQHRNGYSLNDTAHPGGDYIPGDEIFTDLSTLGFSDNNRTVTLYLEGIQPSGSVGDKEILVLLHPVGNNHWTIHDAVRITVVRVNLGIARMNGQPVPRDQKSSNGSVVQLVPDSNPSGLYPNGIFLSIPTITLEPASLANQLSLKLRKLYPEDPVMHQLMSPGEIRVYERPSGQPDFLMVMDPEDPSTDEIQLTAADLTPSAQWQLDSTAGGVSDLALIAERQEGGETTEICRSAIRVSSIPCPPADGRIIFVNPTPLGFATPPYDNFALSAAWDIEQGVTEMQAGDNVLIARLPTTQPAYTENNIVLTVGGVIAGLGGKWSANDPSSADYPRSDVFGFTTLPLIDNQQVEETLPVFRAVGLAGATALRFGGLRFENCTAFGPNLRSGGGILLQNVSVPVSITCCSFKANSADYYGGAVYLSSTAPAVVEFSEFEGNLADHWTTVTDFSHGMGGAIASVESSLTVSDCSFKDNKALASGWGGLSAPPLGSAGGGGDIYATNGSLKITATRSVNAIAGYHISRADHTSQEFTGDGGAVLVHGAAPGTYLEVSRAKFQSAASYGNGGAISISYDSSWKGRQYAVGGLDWSPEPVELSGVCSGAISDTLFESCEGGWHGGALSLNGSGIRMTIQNSQFTNSKATRAHLRDGKGGAVTVGGGVQWDISPKDAVLIQGCQISGCQASGNGGGLYATVRAEMTVTDSLIENCKALNLGATPTIEGMGGGIHITAGGVVHLTGAVNIQQNDAAVSGGGISVKTGRATLESEGFVAANTASGTAASGYGNGGGIFVTTSLYDDSPPTGVGWGAATIYNENGTISCSSELLAVQNNEANRWGGGIYVGISPPWYGTDHSDAAKIQLNSGSVLDNIALTAGYGTLLFPSQIAAEYVSGAMPLPSNLDFSDSSISGNGASDIGIYCWTSILPTASNTVWGTLAIHIVSRP